jgi:hypothetical protein
MATAEGKGLLVLVKRRRISVSTRGREIWKEAN